jgi:glycogen operon protein
VHHIADESFLAELGLTNYWGYSTIGFLAPHAPYASGAAQGHQLREFKGMVKALHRHGIEVILDVVYNHTAEGNHLGPTLSFRGVDNRSYYRLNPDDARFYMDYTGTGNTLDARVPSVLRLIMDSLRYWVLECHVDGFRFDLASALARELYDVDRLSAFFDTIHQDPVLSQVKLIAEPWDVGPGGYQVGNFPVLWTEWNGMYRDTVRDFWRGQASVAEFASRFTGSSDLYENDGRRPFSSINFVTAHDGFTLRDLVSYNEKHNEANLEGNRDGTDDNRSWNCGVEGPTDDVAINVLRARQQRNFLATLFLSLGTPMLLGGDEFGRTQGGNNNAWCQDSEISWFDWDWVPQGAELFAFTRRLIALRQAHPAFRRTRFLHGEEVEGSTLPDVWWFRPDGRRMGQADWARPDAHVLGVFLNGEGLEEVTPQGEPVEDDSFLLLLNAFHEDVEFTLPNPRYGRRWVVELSTADREERQRGKEQDALGPVLVLSRTLLLLRRIA